MSLTKEEEYKLWYAALRGEKIDYPADQPPSGRWRTKGGDLVATWRDENGKILAWTSRAIHGHGQKLEGGHSIGETFSEAFSYPVPYKLWDEVKGGKPWPPEYKTRLTVKEATAGTMWTVEMGRARAGQDVEPEREFPSIKQQMIAKETAVTMPDNPRAVTGDNSPPADLTPDQALAARVRKVASNFQDFLAKIGGKIKTKAEAGVAANYATKFGEFKSLAEVQHKVEKEPFLSKGREVDARWLPTARDAESHRAAVLKYAKVWTDAEQAAREEEARKANEIARQAALKEAQITGEPVEAIAEVKAEKVSIGTAKAITGRAKTIWQVTDSEAYFFYLRKTCPEAFKDVIAAMQKLANAQKSAKVEPRPPGLTEKEQETLR
jgi:hypothetical protein